MISIKQPKTLKMKLSLYFTVVTVATSILISTFYYYYSSGSLKGTMVKDASVNEAYIIDNIDKQLDIAIKFSDWIFLNRTLEKVLLENSVPGPKLDEKLIDAQQILENTVMDSSISKSISAVIISGNNGVDIKYGDDAALINKTDIQKEQWFKDSINKNGAIYLAGIIPNPSEYKKEEYIIPIVRTVIHSTLETNIGWSFIGLRESLISDVYKAFYKQNKNPIYIVDNKGICISSSDKEFIGKAIGGESFIKPVLDTSDATGNFNVKDKKSTSLIVFSKSKMTGWSLVQKISYAPLYEQKSVLLKVSFITFLASIMVALVFIMFLSSNLTKPLQRILKKMRRISQGDFQREPSLEGEDEMGELGKGINDLAANVNKLLEEVKKEEAEKRNLELLVLQSQVNPHFLYNTLNSIKWMATVQGANGIRDMVSALGRLLMNISKEKSEEISIEREFSLLDDYIFIQNIRYNGKIKAQYFIADESLLKKQIIKFTLQPIIENAIFHGIEAKKEAGNIKIGLTEENNDIVLYVEDDGVGMDSETVQKIFSSVEKHQNRGLQSIGLKNVDERLKLFYGSNYGLSIDSKVGEYTRVNIRIPRIDY